MKNPRRKVVVIDRDSGKKTETKSHPSKLAVAIKNAMKMFDKRKNVFYTTESSE